MKQQKIKIRIWIEQIKKNIFEDVPADVTSYMMSETGQLFFRKLWKREFVEKLINFQDLMDKIFKDKQQNVTENS